MDKILDRHEIAVRAIHRSDHVLHLRLQRVHIEDSIVLRRHRVDTAPIVRRKPSRLGGEISRQLHLRRQLLIAQAANEGALGQDVPAMRGFHGPVDITRGQGDAVGARVHKRRRRAVPVADGLAVVHGGEALVGPGEGGVVEVADVRARGEVEGADGAVLGVLGDEGVAARSKRVVDPDVVELQLGVP